MAALIETGKPAPDFALADLEGTPRHLADYRGKIVILNFWSAECPWAARADRDIAPRLRAWGKSVVLLVIASNANETTEMLQGTAAERGLRGVLVDNEQKVADLYQAQTTPHCFVIDEKGILRYQGAYDDATLRQRQPRRSYVCEAVETLLAGKEPEITLAQPYGCTIVRGV